MKLLWVSWIRLFSIVCILGRHGLAHAACLCVGSRSARRVSGPERLRRIFEELGGMYIKFGQMLALQPDILSLEYCNALFNLLDRVRPFDYSEVERTFIEELGRPPAEFFDAIEEQPLATASIGQVHVAWIKGTKVAVKVQRPAVEADFRGDVRLMTATIRVIRRLHIQWLYWVIEPMSEFVAWTTEELDYRCEARYMQQLRENAQDNPQEKVPAVIWGLTTRRILVAEFLEGTTVLAYLRALEVSDHNLFDRLEGRGFDSHEMASNIINNFLGDVFQHGMFHADLHPANLMILPGNVVGYIDFGITGTISSFSRQNLVALTLAYTRGDLESMCESFFRVSAMESTASIARFKAGLARDAKTWYQNDGKEMHLRKNFTLVMLDMLRLSRQTGIWPERDVIKYIRSAIAIDGLITRFAPTFDLGAHLETVCERYLKWHLRSSVFTFNSLLGAAVPLGRLYRDGGLRAADLLAKLAGEGLEFCSKPDGGPPPGTGLRHRTIYLSAFLFTICFEVSMSSEKIQLGWNPFTSEATLAAGALLLLIQTVRKLPIGD
jgi:ubiquinone biosynthesis protein